MPLTQRPRTARRSIVPTNPDRRPARLDPEQALAESIPLLNREHGTRLLFRTRLSR
jgi:hypothetical protein